MVRRYIPIYIWLYIPQEDRKKLAWCEADRFDRGDKLAGDVYERYQKLTDDHVRILTSDVDDYEKRFMIDQAGNLIRKSTKKIVVPADIVTAKIIAHKLKYG